jgi:hypothetical protein
VGGLAVLDAAPEFLFCRSQQTALRTLGIEITFGREGRAGMRIIRMIRAPENTVSTDSSRQQQCVPISAQTPSGRARDQGSGARTMLTLLTQKSAAFACVDQMGGRGTSDMPSRYGAASRAAENRLRPFYFFPICNVCVSV